MRHRRRGAVAILAVFLGACSSASPPAGGSAPVASPVRAGRTLTLPASPLTPGQQILHALNRLGYGPRPGDVERVRRMGLAAYIERQLDAYKATLRGEHLWKRRGRREDLHRG